MQAFLSRDDEWPNGRNIMTRFLGAPLTEYDKLYSIEIARRRGIRGDRAFNIAHMRGKEMKFHSYEFKRAPLITNQTQYGQEYLELAMTRLRSMDFILIVEDLEESFRRYFGTQYKLLKANSINDLANGTYKLPSYRREERYLQPYTPGEELTKNDVSRIEELNDLDMQLYAYGVSLSNRRGKDAGEGSGWGSTGVKEDDITDTTETGSAQGCLPESKLTTFRWDFTDAAVELRHGASHKGSRQCHMSVRKKQVAAGLDLAFCFFSLYLLLVLHAVIALFSSATIRKNTGHYEEKRPRFPSVLA